MSSASPAGPRPAEPPRDPLTGLLGRRRFLSLLEDAVAAARADASLAALLVININGFRGINLLAGPAVADEVLIGAAARLRGALRRGDTLARLGDDEFAALLPGLVSSDHSLLAVDKLLRAFDEPLRGAGQEHAIRVRIGVAMYPDTARDAAELLKQATIAMLHAGAARQSHSVYHLSQDDHSGLASFACELELRSALEQNRLRLHYQPIADAQSGRIVAAEALCRWPGPEELLGPERFIAVAEQSDLIGELTAWSVNEAVRQCAAAGGRGRAFRVSVNLSPRAFETAALDVLIRQALDTWRLDPAALTLEITETGMMRMHQHNREALLALRELGVRLSIDDFGTGYSSFVHLSRLPVQELKIDKSLIAGIERDRRDRTILGAIVDLGHELGLTVTAEGVESEAVYELLREMRCDALQGFHIAPPMPARELAERLQARPPEAGG